MTRTEIAALTDVQLAAFIASMGASTNVLMERAEAERSRRAA